MIHFGHRTEIRTHNMVRIFVDAPNLKELVLGQRHKPMASFHTTWHVGTGGVKYSPGEDWNLHLDLDDAIAQFDLSGKINGTDCEYTVHPVGVR